MRNKTFFSSEFPSEKPKLMREEYSDRSRYFVILLVLVVNVGIYYLGTATFVIALFGSTTAPGCIFVIPGLLFFHDKALSNGGSIHRTLSKALYVCGWLLMIIMTTMSIYSQRSTAL